MAKGVGNVLERHLWARASRGVVGPHRMVAVTPAVPFKRTLAALEPSVAARVLVKRALARVAPEAIVFHGPRKGPARIALTFDDGPDQLTHEYLDLLDRLDVKATFFVVGTLVEKSRAALRETVARGHEVAGHGFFHNPFPDLSGPEIASELLLTQDLLPPSFSKRPIVRPPRGSVSLRSVLNTMTVGFTTVIWSVDSDDCRTHDPRVVEDRLAPANIRPGDIVLLHEGQAWTLQALPTVIGRLRDAGFQFVTVTELCNPRLV